MTGVDADNSEPRTSHLRWFYVLAWMLVIWLFSNQPHSGAITEEYLGIFNVLVRKLAHITEFAILFLLSRHALAGSFPEANSNAGIKLSVTALVITALYAVSDEVHQLYVPGRSGAFHDVAFDCLGAAAAMAAWQLKTRAKS